MINNIIEKIRKPDFWIEVLKVAVPFFILMVIIMIIIANGKDLFAGNFKAVSQTNFENGKWINFFGLKIVISLVYGIYQTMKRKK